MEKINLGNTDLNIYPIIFGGNVFGWTLTEDQGHKILDEFLDSGFTAIDTSNNYPYWKEGCEGTESEEIIGKWIKNRNNRDKIVLATKVGGRNKNQNNPNNRREHIIEELENSLRRLNTDYIDLYQTHYDDESVPIEEALYAYDALIKAGKVRYIGASNFTTARLKSALEMSDKLGLPRYLTLQPEYNLYDREIYESNYEEVALANKLAVIPYYSLASGFLTGKYRNESDLGKSERGGGIKKYLTPRGTKIIDTLIDIANRYDTTPATISLAWLLAQESISAPIVSATSSNQLQSIKNLLSINFKKADADLLTEVSSY